MPFPSASLASYQIASNFIGSDNQKPVEPFIIPPEYGPFGSPQISSPTQVAVQVPGAAGPHFDSGKAVLPSNDDFQLSWLAQGTAQITAGKGANTNVWRIGSTARQALKANFDLMYKGLENLEYQGQLALGAAFIIAQRVAEALPLSLDETLRFRYNFTALTPTNLSAPHGYVDLVPGMRLRVEAAAGLYTSPGSAFNGFVGSGTTYWEIRRRRSDQALLFDAFAGIINSYAPTFSHNGAWGLMDLQSAGSMRYYRLFYPPKQFATWPGYDNCTEMCTLVGTQYLADLDTATTAYTSGQTVPPSDQGPIACTCFRGRTILVPEILTIINNATVWVPLGITARQFIETFTSPSFTAMSWSPPPSSQPVVWYRVWSPADVSTGGLLVQVQGLQDGAFPGSTDAWDLPLVKGDSINVVFSSL